MSPPPSLVCKFKALTITRWWEMYVSAVTSRCGWTAHGATLYCLKMIVRSLAQTSIVHTRFWDFFYDNIGVMIAQETVDLFRKAGFVVPDIYLELGPSPNHIWAIQSSAKVAAIIFSNVLGWVCIHRTLTLILHIYKINPPQYMAIFCTEISS